MFLSVRNGWRSRAWMSCIGAVIVLLPTSKLRAQGLSADDLAAGIRAAADLTPASMKVSYEVSYQGTNWGAGPIRHDMPSGKYVWAIEDYDAGDDAKRYVQGDCAEGSTTRAFNREFSSELYVRKGHDAPIDSRQMATTGRIKAGMKFGDFSALDGISLLLPRMVLFDQWKHALETGSFVVRGKEKVRGYDCYVMEGMSSVYPEHHSAGTRVRVWVAPANGFARIRQEAFPLKDKDSDKLDEFNSFDVLQLRHMENGWWVPTDILYRSGKRVVVDEISVDSQVPDDQFTVRFPDKTIVEDEIAGRTYVVGNDRHAKIKRCLESIIPIAITNQTPYQAVLKRVASSVEGTDWNQIKKEALGSAPTSPLEAANLLKASVHFWTFLAVEYDGYYILSDVINIGQAANTLPVDSEDELKAKLTALVMSNPESFMSGFVIPKGSQKWMKYDFTQTLSVLADNDISIDDIAAGILASRSRIRNLVVDYTVSYPDQRLPPERHHWIMEGVEALEHPAKRHLTIERKGKIDEELAFNGDVATSLFAGVTPHGEVRSTPDAGEFCMREEFPRLLLWIMTDTWDNALANGSFSLTKTESIQGHQCCLIEGRAGIYKKLPNAPSYPVKVWVDPARGFLSVRHEAFWSTNLLEGYSFDVTEAKEVAKGLWIPTAVSYRNGKEIRVDGAALAVNTNLSDDAFTVTFPDGTEVDDMAAGVSYIKGQEKRDARPMKGVGDASAATPQDAARTFVAAMGSGDVDTAKKAFPSEEEFMAIFEGDKLEQKYKEFRNRFNAAVNTVMPEMTGASFVRLDLRMSSPSPIEVAAGKEIADGVTLKDATMGIDNARIWVEVNGVQREMYVGPMIRVGKVWRILAEVKLYPARPKR